MSEHTHDLLEAAKALAPETVELRRELHANPEIGLHLPGTQQRILDALTGLGLDITLGESLSSVVADLDTGKEGPTVLLRGDMDALPLTEDTDLPFKSTVEGRMHACGHDTHVAMLVGAAKLLSDNKSEFNGKVRFMFQPGEEGYHGAKFMIEEGVVDGVDRAFAIHVDSNTPLGIIGSRPGAMAASSDELEITVRGRGGHASMPHVAADPIAAAAGITTGLYTMVTRDIDAFDPAMVTVASIHGGTAGNIIPETAELVGTIRAVSEETRETVHDMITRVAQGIASAHGCTADVNIIKGYPVTINDAAMVKVVENAAATVLGEGRYLDAPTPIMGSEDFSYVLQRVPGAMMGLGLCPDGYDNPYAAPSLHSNRAMLNEAGLPVGVAMHAAVAMAR